MDPASSNIVELKAGKNYESAFKIKTDWTKTIRGILKRGVGVVITFEEKL